MGRRFEACRVSGGPVKGFKVEAVGAKVRCEDLSNLIYAIRKIPHFAAIHILEAVSSKA